MLFRKRNERETDCKQSKVCGSVRLIRLCNYVPGGGGTSYNGLYGEAPPERGTFFRLEVYKRVRISRAEG